MSAQAKVKKRQSNLELFRIFLMLGIVAHHYVVHSGLLDLVYASGGKLNTQNLFIVILGMWGKIGINCFILITGYFMCKSKITLEKFLKLVLQVIFYDVIIYFGFVLLGKTELTLSGIKDAFFPISGFTANFTGCFLVFYLFIPFLNILIANLDRKKHLMLLVLSIFWFSLVAVMPDFPVAVNYVFWFMIIYLIGAYIRLYLSKPNRQQLKVSIVITAGCVVICILSVIFGLKMGREWLYWFVMDSNKFLAVIMSVALFMLFLNIKMKYHPVINKIASATFGVLLIHDNGWVMRRILWVSLLKNASFYGRKMLYIHAPLAILGTFMVCVIIDLLRAKFLEKPVLKLALRWSRSRVLRRLLCYHGKDQTRAS